MEIILANGALGTYWYTGILVFSAGIVYPPSNSWHSTRSRVTTSSYYFAQKHSILWSSSTPVLLYQYQDIPQVIRLHIMIRSSYDHKLHDFILARLHRLLRNSKRYNNMDKFLYFDNQFTLVKCLEKIIQHCEKYFAFNMRFQYQSFIIVLCKGVPHVAKQMVFPSCNRSKKTAVAASYSFFIWGFKYLLHFPLCHLLQQNTTER